MLRGLVDLPLKSIIPPYLIGLTLTLSLYGVRGFRPPNLIIISTTHPDFIEPSDHILSFIFLVSYLLAVETALTGYDVWNIAIHFVVRTGVEPSYGVGLEGSFYNLMQLNTILIVLVSTPVQCFYVWRFRALQNSWYLTILMYFLSFISLVMGIVTAVVVPRGIPLVIAAKFIGKSNFPGDSGLWTLLPTLLWLGSSALVDVLVTGGLFYKLSKSRTGMKRTDTVVNSVIQLAIETGFLTSACIIAEIVLFLIEAFDKHGGLNSDDYFSNHGFLAKYVIADFALSKLYANTLLATLNARVTWRAKAMEADTLKTEDIFEV
ncbi:hypothetical protein ONZ45_g6927 [Pleurotus djamor]|nr:hypothetical protein ONZ45_g6927 [Pleurotus djamor]